MYYLYPFSYHPLINPIVNPADMLPVSGIPKLVIANEAAAVSAQVNQQKLNYKAEISRRLNMSYGENR
jgi:hypothetical protein